MPRVRDKTLRPLLVLVTAALSGCAGNAPVDAWVASEMTNLTSLTPQSNDPEVFDADDAVVKLFAAGNETVSFQLVIDAGDRPISGLRIEWTDLPGRNGRKIPAAEIRAFRALPIRVETYPPWYLRLVDTVPSPADFYDPLIPVDSPRQGMPFSLDRGQRLVVWVDVHVSRQTLPGTYAGQLRVSTPWRRDWTAGLEVQVYDFVLPDARPIATVGGFDHAELFKATLTRDGKPFVPVRLDRTNDEVRQGLIVIRDLMRLAHEHRLDLFDKRIAPILKRDANGSLKLGWEDYDAIVGPYLSGSAFEDGIGCAAWPVPFWDQFPNPNRYGGTDSRRYEATATAWLDQCARHMTDTLKAGMQAFVWPYRGPINPQAYPQQLRAARLARRVAPQLPVLSRLPADPPPMTTWAAPQDLAALTDIQAPPAHWLDPATAAGLARPAHPLKGVWLAPGKPPYLPSLGIIASPADVRAIAWFAMKYRCTGLFLDEVLHWDVNEPHGLADAQTRLFYPGSLAGIRRPLPSVRLKRLRRGLTDIAYLWILQQRQRDAIAQSIINSLTHYAALEAVGDNYLDPRLDGWVQDPAAWTLARRLLAEEIQTAVHDGEMSSRDLLKLRMQWKQLVERTRRVRIEQVRTRITPAGQPDMLRAAVLLDVYNPYGRTVKLRANLEVEGLGQGWTATRGALDVSLPAGARKVLELVARGPYVPPGPSGKVPVKLALSEDSLHQQELTVQVPLLTARKTPQPPKIDGLLNDWPMREGNAAGDFRLIGRRGASGDGLAQRQTRAFVLRDAKNLYVAFRCDEPNLQGITCRASNIIHYEQLMACGEDLVEVILDPGADAVGPADLYHVVVKANGALLTERGVRTDPPLGKVRPWPVAASVAVARLPGVWTLELAIPLEAFGDDAKATLWAVNFTRFATQGAEASSWSGAPRYFYDPRNLGTMLVPPESGPR